MAGVLPLATSSRYGRMLRFSLIVATALPLLAGCATSPASLGLTGAVPPAVPEAPSDAVIGLPGVQPETGLSTPSFTPSTGSGRYFGYDD